MCHACGVLARLNEALNMNKLTANDIKAIVLKKKKKLHDFKNKKSYFNKFETDEKAFE